MERPWGPLPRPLGAVNTLPSERGAVPLPGSEERFSLCRPVCLPCLLLDSSLHCPGLHASCRTPFPSRASPPLLISDSASVRSALAYPCQPNDPLLQAPALTTSGTARPDLCSLSRPAPAQTSASSDGILPLAVGNLPVFSSLWGSVRSGIPQA